MIDPLGFALENFDVIGGWRTIDEAGKPVDATGTTASGAKIDGLPGLRTLLLEQPEQFPRTVTEKLMAYALGRQVEYYDQPAVRKIVRDAAAENYRWSSLVLELWKARVFGCGQTRALNMNFLHRRRYRDAPYCGAWARRSRCRSWTRCSGVVVRAARRREAAHRFQAFYVPNGMAMEYWTPKTEGATSSSRRSCEPLAPYRDQMLVLSGIKANWNYIHAGASGSFLTGTTARRRNGNRDHRRRVDRSDARAALRQGDAGRRRSNCRWTSRPTPARAPAI